MATGESPGAVVGAASISLNLGSGRSLGVLGSLVQQMHELRDAAMTLAVTMAMRRIMIRRMLNWNGFAENGRMVSPITLQMRYGTLGCPLLGRCLVSGSRSGCSRAAGRCTEGCDGCNNGDFDEFHGVVYLTV